MNKTIASMVALGVAISLPIGFASPAFALNTRLAITVDCDLGETEEDDHVIAPTDVLTITLLNCEGEDAIDDDDTGSAVLNGTTTLTPTAFVLGSGPQQIVVTGSTDIHIADLEIGVIDIDVNSAGPAYTPSSTLLATEVLTLEVGAPETMIRESAIGDPVADDGEGDVYVGGNEECEVIPGEHVYTTFEIDVVIAGDYEFVATAVSPVDEDLVWGEPKYPSSDPFIALYTTFDPANPESGVVACNDDGDESAITAVNEAWFNAGGDDYDGLELYNGDIIDDQWPWLGSTLDVGRYTLVYMPYYAIGSEQFASGEGSVASGYEDDWTPSPQSVTYDMWGPEGGFTSQLADTGVNPTLGIWVAIGLLVVGGSFAVVRRKLAPRGRANLS
jgi:hypothetical protein